MTYGQVKRAALRLLNASTVGGSEIPLSYNEQADLVLAMPSLVDDAVMQIATTVKKIPAVVRLDELMQIRVGENVLYKLPTDCWRLMDGGLLRLESGERFRGYKRLAHQLLLPAGEKGLWAEYWRYPSSVGNTPADSVPLDNSPDTHTAIPYFVAGQLVMYDDAFRYAALHNEWESRLRRLGEPVFTEQSQVRDAYAGFDCGGLW